LFSARSLIQLKAEHVNILLPWITGSSSSQKERGVAVGTTMLDLILSKEEELVGVRTSWKRAASQPRVPTHKRETLKQNTAHRYQERMLQKVQRREWSCDSMRVSEREDVCEE